MGADQYERQLLSEVIPPEEINVKFEDIGALEAVKTTLHEVSIWVGGVPEWVGGWGCLCIKL